MYEFMLEATVHHSGDVMVAETGGGGRSHCEHNVDAGRDECWSPVHCLLSI